MLFAPTKFVRDIITEQTEWSYLDHLKSLNYLMKQVINSLKLKGSMNSSLFVIHQVVNCFPSSSCCFSD